MSLEESVVSLVAFNKKNVDDIMVVINGIPDRIRAVIADYVAENPAGEGSVPDAVILQALETIREDSKNLVAGAGAIGTFFDNQIANGDPLP